MGPRPAPFLFGAGGRGSEESGRKAVKAKKTGFFRLAAASPRRYMANNDVPDSRFSGIYCGDHPEDGANPNMTQRRCCNCGALLGVEQDGEFVVSYKGLSLAVEPNSTLRIACRKCRMLNKVHVESKQEPKQR
jgi:hypothetical protein